MREELETFAWNEEHSGNREILIDNMNKFKHSVEVSYENVIKKVVHS